MHISEINIYPVKSLKGIPLTSAKVEKRGLEYDRRWMLTDKSGMFFTQREFPRMALIDVQVNGDSLIVSVPETEPMSIPHGAAKDFVKSQNVTVWGSVCDAMLYPREVNEWFSDFLGTDCQIVYMHDASERPVSEKFDRGGDIVSFADGYPLLVIGEASLAELNRRIGEASGGSAVQSEEGDAGMLPAVRLPMKRFRPNIVVSGSDAFAEDSWHRIRVGEAIFRVVKPCARCVMTTVDPARGEFDGKEPLKTMASFRMAKQVFPETYESYGHTPNAVLFGENLIPENPGASINTGDEAEVLAYR